MRIGGINRSRIIGIFCAAIVLGLLYGLAVSISNIFTYDYLSHQLYNLSLFNLQSEITAYALTFIILFVLAYICFGVVKRLSESKYFIFKNLKPKQFKAFLFFINLSVMCALTYLFFFNDIIHALKVFSLNPWFHNFLKSPITTFRIVVALFLLSTLISLVLITIIFSRLNLIDSTISALTRAIDSKRIKYAGYAAFALIIFFNISIWAYKGLNEPDGPNIVLITIDTLRADRLGSYGYGRDTSPNIDQLAEYGALYENAYSQSSWTYPSMASMHTSLYPTQLGVNRFQSRINEKLLTLAERMSNNFYNTYAVVANIVVSRVFGFGQGFDTFEETFSTKPYKTSSKLTTERAIDYIKKNKDNKFFAWIHYMDPHSHYLNHDDFDYASDYSGKIPPSVGTVKLNLIKNSLNEEDLRYVNGLYDEEIAYTDMYIGKLIDTLSELEIDDNTVIILTADHGEELLDRSRFGHGETLYQEVIRVPLIVYDPRDPKISGKRVSDNVEVRYIAKTILDLVNINSDDFEGHNLVTIAEKGSGNSIAYSQIGKTLSALYIAEWKLISNSDEDKVELFNINEDPNEKLNEYASKQDDVVEVKNMLEAKLTDYKNFKQAETKDLVLSQEDIDKLKALGYMQ